MASSGIHLGAWDYLKWGHIRTIIRRIKGHGSAKFTLPSCRKSR
jgi:hypothetical protein